MKPIYKTHKNKVVFDKMQAIANIYEYNKKLGAMDVLQWYWKNIPANDD